MTYTNTHTHTRAHTFIHTQKYTHITRCVLIILIFRYDGQTLLEVITDSDTGDILMLKLCKLFENKNMFCYFHLYLRQTSLITLYNKCIVPSSVPTANESRPDIGMDIEYLINDMYLQSLNSFKK